MKTKKESRFALDKFEVAKLKNTTMKKVNGNGGGKNLDGNEDNTYSITDVLNGGSSKKCSGS